MSYKYKKKSDTLNTYFTNLIQFNNMKGNLVNCIKENNYDGFLRWVEKLKMVDPRALQIILKKHESMLSPKMKSFAQAALKINLSDIVYQNDL